MTIIRKIFVVSLLTGAGFLAGVLFNSVSYYRSTIFVMDTLSSANQAYLSDRFIMAYHQQPVAIALWEGTNLVSFLEKNSEKQLSLEERANRAFLHARLYALLMESGSPKQAAAEAKEASMWFKTITTNQPMISSVEVVSNLLDRDSVKRVNYKRVSQ